MNRLYRCRLFITVGPEVRDGLLIQHVQCMHLKQLPPRNQNDEDDEDTRSPKRVKPSNGESDVITSNDISAILNLSHNSGMGADAVQEDDDDEDDDDEVEEDEETEAKDEEGPSESESEEEEEDDGCESIIPHHLTLSVTFGQGKTD
jgi:hypothetical protein